MALPSVAAPRQLTHDALRWWAFVAIFLAHAGPTATAFAPATPAVAWLNSALLAVGNVGAHVFFTLSGYWLIHQLAGEKARTGRVAIGRFWIGRAGRLLPLYCLGLLIGFGLEPLLAAARHLPYAEPARLTYYVLGLANFDKLRIQPASWVLAELWAIAVIGQFAGLAPLLVAAMSRRWLAGALGLIVLASLSFQILHAGERLILKLHSAAVFTDFAIGGLAALAAFRWPAKTRDSPQSQQLWAVGLGLLALAPLRLALLASPATAPITRLVVSGGVAAGLLLLGWRLGSVSESPRSPEGRWARLGRLSFGLYALHTAALEIMAGAVRALPPHLQPGAGLGLVPIGGLALTLLFATLSDRWVERPFRSA